MNMLITPRASFYYLSLFICFLLMANVTGIFIKYYLHHDYVYGLIPLFDFNKENNIPTLYSSLSLILCSVLLSLIAHNKYTTGLPGLPWAGLAVIFVFLSIDETASIHEQLDIPLRQLLNTSGLFYFAWVIPYSAFLIVLFLIYLRFLMGLPKKIKSLFLLSGSIFVSGAIGLELLCSRQYELHGEDNLLYSILYTFEELFEMFGIVIFIYALLSYISSECNSLTLSIKTDSTSQHISSE